VSSNPFDDDFDDEKGSFFVLVNDEEQEANWTDIPPKSLRERLAQGAGS
jgi:uncharacterized protein YbdZ (MbtH family)